MWDIIILTWYMYLSNDLQGLGKAMFLLVEIVTVHTSIPDVLWLHLGGHS